jgi:hypothetical protein
VNPEAKNKPRDICPVKKGYGMGVVSMNPITGASLYSVRDKLCRVIPSTLEDNRNRQQALQSKYHSIKDLIQTQSVPFFVKTVSKDACFEVDERPEMASEPRQIMLSNWCSVPGGDRGNCVDILMVCCHMPLSIHFQSSKMAHFVFQCCNKELVIIVFITLQNPECAIPDDNW